MVIEHLERIVKEACQVYRMADMPWETKYQIIFKLAGMISDLGIHIEYYDPDTTYEEDVTAYINALKSTFPEWCE